MPPKKKQRLKSDYDWVETVADSSQITDTHRRSAAGLCGHLQCPFVHALPRSRSSRSDTGSDVVVTKDDNCKAAKCKKNARCYNHLGAEEVVKETKEEWVQWKLGDSVGRRTEEEFAGLRNLGATCYANAFLQVWYRNIIFRNAVYKAVQTADTRSPLYHLAMVFASMQYSERTVVDPTPLIDILGLKRSDQQDAAEFSKLFTNLVANAFSRQADPSLKNVLSELFEGKMEHHVECLRCHTTSSRQESFFELDLPLKNNNTVEECLRRIQSTEILSGDNQYRCAKCDSLQDAERRSFVRILPPYLNLSLMRFTYSANGRTKSKANIRYGRVLALGNQQYKLCAVVSHVGTSAHHGHFKCDVYDDQADKWIVCNDELIEKPDKKKRRRLDPGESSDYTSCDQAYMLVYRLEKEVNPMQPSRAIMDKVEEDNATLETEMNDRKFQEERMGDEWEHLHGAKMEVIRLLPGTDKIVITTTIAEWLDVSEFDKLYQDWTYDSIMCSHGALDPLKGDEQYDPSMPDLKPCATCVTEEYVRLKQNKSHSENVAMFDELNIEPRGYLLPRRWLELWRKGNLDDRSPNHPDFTLLCDHKARWEQNRKTSSVSEECIALLQSLVGHFDVFTNDAPVCGDCAEEYAGTKEEKDEMVKQAKEEHAALKKHINPHGFAPPFGMPFYLLPEGWVGDWKSWVAGNGDRPEYEVPICEHGGLEWDPAMSWPHYTNEQGWRVIRQKYNNPTKVIGEYVANPLPGKKSNVGLVDPPVCDGCTARKALDFVSTTINVVVGQISESKTLGNRRITRSKGKTYKLEVDKTTTIKEIKVEICQLTGISPIAQSLRYDNEELDDSSKTIHDINIFSNATIHCEILEEDEHAMNGIEEGFGGTALVGNDVEMLPCRQCTLLNPKGVLACEACETPFA